MEYSDRKMQARIHYSHQTFCNRLKVWLNCCAKFKHIMYPEDLLLAQHSQFVRQHQSRWHVSGRITKQQYSWLIAGCSHAKQINEEAAKQRSSNNSITIVMEWALCLQSEIVRATSERTQICRLLSLNRDIGFKAWFKHWIRDLTCSFTLDKETTVVCCLTSTARCALDIDPSSLSGKSWLAESSNKLRASHYQIQLAPKTISMHINVKLDRYCTKQRAIILLQVSYLGKLEGAREYGRSNPHQVGA